MRSPDFYAVTKIRNQVLIKNFGSHLRELRLKNNLTQEQLANKADIPISQIGRMERGEINVTISTLDQIAKALRMSLSGLMDFDESMTS